MRTSPLLANAHNSLMFHRFVLGQHGWHPLCCITLRDRRSTKTSNSFHERKMIMKIAITAEQSQLDSAVDSRFGRCPFFFFTDTENQEWEAVENRGATLSSGAGIGAAQFVVNKGVKAVITGIVGPKATQVLTAAGVRT
jgi:predicted Fe-Mo cluster-binding NifX family protein